MAEATTIVDPFARLTGRHVSLRPVVPGDAPALYAIANSDSNTFRWRYRGLVPTPEQFEVDLLQGAYQAFTVVANDTSAAVGLVVAYNHDPVNAVCSVAVLVAEELVGRRVGREAMDLFVTHLFRISPLRKVYAEVPGSTVAGVKPSSQEGGFEDRFRIEGCLTDHWFIDGAYQDMVIVATHRDDWCGPAPRPAADAAEASSGEASPER